MKRLVLLLAIFCIFFTKNMCAQTNSKFSVETDAISSKKVLFYNHSLFLGNKEDAEKLSENNFIANTKDNVFVLKVIESGHVTKSVFLRKNYKWFWVTDGITDNFVVDTKVEGVTIEIIITYDNHNTEYYHF